MEIDFIACAGRRIGQAFMLAGAVLLLISLWGCSNTTRYRELPPAPASEEFRFGEEVPIPPGAAKEKCAPVFSPTGFG